MFVYSYFIILISYLIFLYVDLHSIFQYYLLSLIIEQHTSLPSIFYSIHLK